MGSESILKSSRWFGGWSSCTHRHFQRAISVCVELLLAAFFFRLVPSPLVFALSAPQELSFTGLAKQAALPFADDSHDAGGGTNVSAPTLPLSLPLMSDCCSSWRSSKLMTAPVADVAVPHCFHRHKVDVPGTFYTRCHPPNARMSSHSSLPGNSQNRYFVLIKKLIGCTSEEWTGPMTGELFSFSVLPTQRQTQTQMFVVFLGCLRNRLQMNCSNTLVWENCSSWAESHPAHCLILPSKSSHDLFGITFGSMCSLLQLLH